MILLNSSLRSPSRRQRRNARNRKGAAMVLAVILLGVLVSMLAFSIDIGFIAASKSEARRTADAAALAGCWQPLLTAVPPGSTITVTITANANRVSWMGESFFMSGKTITASTSMRRESL